MYRRMFLLWICSCCLFWLLLWLLLLFLLFVIVEVMKVKVYYSRRPCLVSLRLLLLFLAVIKSLYFDFPDFFFICFLIPLFKNVNESIL